MGGQWGWVDGLLLLVLLSSAVLGLWRGVLFESLSLVSWVLAWWLARWGAPALTPHWPTVPNVVVYGLVFLVSLLACSVLARLLRLVVTFTPLVLLDRLLGALFGFMRGMVLLLVLALLVTWTPVSRWPVWIQSAGAQWLTQCLQWLRPLAPMEWGQHLPA